MKPLPKRIPNSPTLQLIVRVILKKDVYGMISEYLSTDTLKAIESGSESNFADSTIYKLDEGVHALQKTSQFSFITDIYTLDHSKFSSQEEFDIFLLLCTLRNPVSTLLQTLVLDDIKDKAEKSMDQTALNVGDSFFPPDKDPIRRNIGRALSLGDDISGSPIVIKNIDPHFSALYSERFISQYLIPAVRAQSRPIFVANLPYFPTKDYVSIRPEDAGTQVSMQYWGNIADTAVVRKALRLENDLYEVNFWIMIFIMYARSTDHSLPQAAAHLEVQTENDVIDELWDFVVERSAAALSEGESFVPPIEFTPTASHKSYRTLSEIFSEVKRAFRNVNNYCNAPYTLSSWPLSADSIALKRFNGVDMDTLVSLGEGVLVRVPAEGPWYTESFITANYSDAVFLGKGDEERLVFFHETVFGVTIMGVQPSELSKMGTITYQLMWSKP